MNRREWIAMAAVSAAAQTAKPKVTSSVMLWTLRGTYDERLEIAARAGMQSVELVSEHVAWTDAEAARRKKQVESYGMTWDTILAQTDWAKRPVSMVDPAHRDGFLADVRASIEWAKKLGVPQIILMSGNAIAGRTREAQYASCVEGAKRAGDLAAKANVTLIVEPLNAKVDHKGFFLTTCAEGLKLVKEVANPHVRLLYDVYHEHVETGNGAGLIAEAVEHTAVFHVADSPGRHDPGTGVMKWPDIYKAIAKSGFGGYVTMEYLPVADPLRSLVKAVDGMRAGIS